MKDTGYELRVTHDECYNDFSFLVIYNQLKEYAINMFKWHGLPETCDERFLELILYEFGYALFFQKNESAYMGSQPADALGNGALLALQATIGGTFDIYRRPIYRRAYAVNGFNQECSDLDSVIIFNNFLRQPTFPTIEYYAKTLWDIKRTLDINLNANKTPVLIRTSKQQQLTLQNVYKKYQGNMPVIYGDKDIDLSQFGVLKTDAPYLVDKLLDAYDRVWNQAMTFVGLNNANTQKKERLVTPEANANNSQIQASRDVMLNAREQAAEQINRMFWNVLDEEIWPEFRQQEREDLALEKEAGDNELLHSNA